MIVFEHLLRSGLYAEHLFRSYGPFDHHGIGQEDGTVIEYGGKRMGKASVRRITFAEFANGGDVRIMPYAAGVTLAPEETVRRSQSRLTEQQYRLFDNNCEHFAYWCKTGRHLSPQADQLRGVLTAGAILVGVAVVAKLIEESSESSGGRVFRTFAGRC